jgi:signal transduction histidine kinase
MKGQTSKQRLRILIVEDSEDDAMLIAQSLYRSGFETGYVRVDSEEELQQALANERWDLVISDYSLPGLDGFAALEIFKQFDLDIPFIVVSGTIGEETAAKVMRAGAHDYIMKFGLARLGPAVERELQEALGRRARRRAEQNEAELFRQNRLLVQQLINVQEKEYRELARELHDELGQCMTAIKTDAALMCQYSIEDKPELHKLAESILDISRHTYGVVHDMMKRLRPTALDDLGLSDAIQVCINNSKLQKLGIECTLDINGKVDDFGEAINITIYRIVQEGLTNIAKYAKAGNVLVSLNRISDVADQDRIFLEIRDDGIGMDTEQRLSERKFGLAGMRERTQALGGKFLLSSTPGQGVRIYVTIPLV